MSANVPKGDKRNRVNTIRQVGSGVDAGEVRPSTLEATSIHNTARHKLNKPSRRAAYSENPRRSIDALWANRSRAFRRTAQTGARRFFLIATKIDATGSLDGRIVGNAPSHIRNIKISFPAESVLLSKNAQFRKSPQFSVDFCFYCQGLRKLFFSNSSPGVNSRVENKKSRPELLPF